VSSCYLCVAASLNTIGTPAGGGTSREGFGTCDTCSVHACSQHGITVSNIFLCADCTASTSAASAVGAGPAGGTGASVPGAPDIANAVLLRILNQSGLAGLMAFGAQLNF
jgi:hypothetical protein